MPIPEELLDNLKARIDEGEASLKAIGETISDLRAASIDASQQEEKLKEAKEDLQKLRIFYERQIKRIE